MKVLSVVGSESAAVADRLAERLAERGAVGTVTKGSPEATDSTAFELGDGGWRARGANRSLTDALDELAPDHEFAVVSGFPDANVPRVVLGDADPAGEPLVSAPDADALDIESVVDALDDVGEYETLESLVARAKRSASAERSGAIATFTGRVRAKDSADDSPTEFLEFEKYEGVAEARMDAIREELEAREGVFDVLMHHRTGRIEYGEDIVFVVVLAGHREEAFRTVEDGINRLKAEVPIFKKEATTDEQFWVHER
ncbi:molybdopterin synthase [Haladaptatus salinisoli]|uniref:molybdopterin synthase n=1 Tax=Haladaptatus salinisoli TaxID=2884876 RepID=UPI001D0BB90E|nr:molybdopterin synthase [Haladaptatus salinisoli]